VVVGEGGAKGAEGGSEAGGGGGGGGVGFFCCCLSWVAACAARVGEGVYEVMTIEISTVTDSGLGCH
jgi:hypothetical protein